MFSKRSPERKIDLSHFVFEVTPRCNQHCCYCYNAWRHNKYPEGELDINSWSEIVRKLKDETKVRLVSLSGGEPLMYGRIFELIDLLNKNGVMTNLLTNGSLVDEETAKRLVRSGISLFEVPLIASDPETHRLIKGVDDFGKVIEGIANLKHSGGRIVAAFVATKDNISHLKETLDLAVVLGCTGLMFNRINPACAEHLALMPSADQLRESLEYLETFARKYRFPISCSIPMPPCVIDMKRFPHIGHGFCPSGDKRSYYTVDFFGNVRICNHSPTILGNLLQSDLREITKHNYVEEFKDALPKECSHCQSRDFCRGGCKASAEICHGTLCCIDPFVKAASLGPPS